MSLIKKIAKRVVIASAVFAVIAMTGLAANTAEAKRAAPSLSASVKPTLPMNQNYQVLAQLAVFQDVTDANIAAAPAVSQKPTRVRLVVTDDAVGGSYVFYGSKLRCAKIPSIIGGSLPSSIVCADI